MADKSYQELIITNFGLSPSGYTGSQGAVGYTGSAGAAAIAPKISSIVYVDNDTATIPTGGQTVTLNGTGFVSGATVVINGTLASVVTFINSTQITFTAPANATGSYIVYVVNPDGGTAIAVPGIQYSGTPTWSTAAGSLGSVLKSANVNISVSATGDVPITYSVYSGTLPSGVTLNSSTGVLSGTAPAVSSATTYNFVIRASDAQNQDTDRSFSLTISVETYWFTTIYGPYSDSINGLAVDSSGNVFIAGATQQLTSGNAFDMVIAKYTKSGSVAWQKFLYGATASNYEQAFGAGVDGSGNVYFSGWASVTTSPSTADVFLTKYNTAGVLQWQVGIGASSDDRSQSMTVDSTGNSYIVGYYSNSTDADILVAKFNTSGTQQWARILKSAGGTGLSYNDYGTGIAVDGSGNVYITGYKGISGGVIITAKYNSSGTIQWQRTLSGTVTRGITVDSSGNTYIVGESTATGTRHILLAKYDTSGTIIWQRTLSSSAADYAQGITIDSSNYIYICGSTDQSGSTCPLIAKYDTSGNILWQRTIVPSSGGYGRATAIGVDNLGSMYVGIGSDVTVARLPADGTMTANYTHNGTSISYTSTSLTDAAGSFTDAAGAFTDASAPVSDTTSSVTITAMTGNLTVASTAL